MTTLDALPIREWGIRIGGEEVETTSSRSTTRTMPGRDDRTVGTFGVAGPGDVDRAVRTVARAQPAWAGSRPKERSQVLLRAASLLQERSGELAAWECLESGMLLPLARDHARWCVELLEYSAGMARALSGRSVDLGSGKLGLVLPEPYPVVAALGPWNFPLSELIWKVAPALAVGCGVVMKPSELTPVTTLILDEVLADAGVPPGVTAVLTGDGEVGQALAAHPDVGMVSLTGGASTGRAVLRTAAERIVPTLLELGGKSAIVVLPDADPEVVASIAAPAVRFRTGQSCTCPSRIVAVGGPGRSRRVAEALDEAFRREVSGPPDADGVTVGPAIHAAHADSVRGALHRATERGAEVLGGSGTEGAYLSPAVVLEVPADDPLVTDEVFGPVTAVLPAASVEDAVRLANASRYGLAGGVVSGGDLGTAVAVARRLRAGTVWVDEWGAIELEVPFGGVAESGFGRELGIEGMEAFVTWKSIHLPHRSIDGDGPGA